MWFQDLVGRRFVTRHSEPVVVHRIDRQPNQVQPRRFTVHDPTDPVGRLRGKQLKPSAKQEDCLVASSRAGGHTTLELAELFTVCRAIEGACVSGRTAS